MQAGFYATPIIYPLQMVKNAMVEKLLLLNPMAMIIQGARHDLVNPAQTISFQVAWASRPWMIIVPLVLTVAVAVIGGLYFRKQSKYFAENI